MKKLIAVLMMTVALASCSSVSVPKITPSVIVETSKGKEAGHGSGVYIGNGYFVTANHVTVNTGNDIVIRDINDHKHTAKFLWGSKEYDVALLKVDFDIPDFETPNLVCRDLKFGEKLWTYGSPLEFEFLRISGEVVSGKSQTADLWKKFFITDLKVLPGNSGGPVFDNANNLVGIAVGMFASPLGEGNFIPMGYSFVVPSSVICDLMAKNS